jgi:hypothetical protein
MIRAALVSLALLLAPGAAVARDAGCRIEQAGRVVLDRTCDFAPDGRDGSFTLSPRGGGQGALFGPILMVSVSVIEPGLAEVRGLTRDGINSRWGAARRSARDGACWEGSDFRICAR